jgi:hypothetical protein
MNLLLFFDLAKFYHIFELLIFDTKSLKQHLLKRNLRLIQSHKKHLLYCLDEN